MQALLYNSLKVLLRMKNDSYFKNICIIQIYLLEFNYKTIIND